MDTSIRRIKKIERKEKKENVYGSTQWGTDMKHFFLPNRCFQLCSIKSLFLSLSNILDSCQCSV